MSEINELSIAIGDDLTPETFANFVKRLRHDCVGEGVRDHCTAAALFTVQAQRTAYGFEVDYAEGLCVYRDGCCWFSPLEYWADLDGDEQLELDVKAAEGGDCTFLELDSDDQWELLGELEDHTVTGWNKRWEIVNSHFTKDAAEAFIRRKQHDYPPLRVYVEAQIYCWEFEAIKNALIDGRLVLATPAV